MRAQDPAGRGHGRSSAPTWPPSAPGGEGDVQPVVDEAGRPGGAAEGDDPDRQVVRLAVGDGVLRPDLHDAEPGGQGVGDHAEDVTAGTGVGDEMESSERLHRDSFSDMKQVRLGRTG